MNYVSYYEAVLPRLSERGLIAADNTLWSGRVLEPDDSEGTQAIVAFNEHVRADPARGGRSAHRARRDHADPPRHLGMRRAGLLLALVAALRGCRDAARARRRRDRPAPATDAERPSAGAVRPGRRRPAAPELPPTSRAMSWAAAGAFVWHETDVDPELLGRDLLEAGFGWVAVFLHDGTAEDPVEADWVTRFRRVTGLPVGGWGVLRTRPAEEAAFARPATGPVRARLLCRGRRDRVRVLGRRVG